MPLDTYDEQAELADIATRYDRSLALLPRTLPRLRDDVIFHNLVRRLRDDGWRDWHILQAVVNEVINWHLARMGQDRDPEAMRPNNNPMVRRLLEQGEAPDDPVVPPAHFTPQVMERQLDLGIHTFLKRHGVVFRDRRYGHERMRRIVAERYGYFELDCPHPALFPEDSAMDESD